MRHATTGLILVLLLSFAGAAMGDEAAPNPYLTEEEHAELLQLLDESRELLMGLIDGLSDEQWTFKQNPDRWSVAECTEHIVRSETALLEYARTAMSHDADAEWYERTKGKTNMLRQFMPNRRPMGQGGATAPMEIRPRENWSQAKAHEELNKIRSEVRAYAEAIDGPIKEHTEEHPFPVFSWLSAHDWLIYIPLHTIRHSRQIIEVQEDTNYPKS